MVISRFTELCEVVNALAIIFSVNFEDRHIVNSLAGILKEYMPQVVGYIDRCRQEDVRILASKTHLTYLTGRVFLNYAHCNIISGASREEIMKCLDNILIEQLDGYEQQIESGFGGNPDERKTTDIIFK